MLAMLSLKIFQCLAKLLPKEPLALTNELLEFLEILIVHYFIQPNELAMSTSRTRTRK